MNYQIPTSSIDAAKLPIDQAQGIPNEYYTDETRFREEKRAVFAPNWTGIGTVSVVPKAGDVKPVWLMGEPLLIARGRDEAIRVFYNVCRHRGMILYQKPQSLKGVIRCPYHSWCYGLDGQLVTTPHVGGPGQNTHEAIDRETMGLVEVRSTVWMGVVFVNLSGDAPDFDIYAGPLKKQWAEFEKPIYHTGADSSFKLEINCNWKLAVENYCESYHLPWVHPGLNSYSRLEDHYNIMLEDQFSGQGTLVYNPSLDDGGKQLPNFDNLSSKWDKSAEYITFVPNVLFGVHRDHVFSIVLEPVSENKTIEHIEIFYADDSVKGDEYAHMRQKNSAMWKEVFQEDIFVVEGMQKGREASGFDGGHFSPVMDEATHVFHKWIADQWTKEKVKEI